MKKANINDASAKYREAASVCRQLFEAAGRKFQEPQGVRALIQNAREQFVNHGNEAEAAKEMENARIWLTAIATKFLRTGVQFFDGRINELSYMSLDRDIVENIRARWNELRDAVVSEDGPRFDRRLSAYIALTAAVADARDEQGRRERRRTERAEAELSRKQRERALHRRQAEEARVNEARRLREAAEAAARSKREQIFDDLFA